MTKSILGVLILISSLTSAQKKTAYISWGLDYRTKPFDIENMARGPLPRDNGLPSDDSKFWQVISVHASYGINLKKKWSLSLSFYSRYNLLHRLEGINVDTPYPKNISEKKTFKYDGFIDIEKKIRLKKGGHFVFLMAGVGITNINSRYDITLTDSAAFGQFPPYRYKGTFLCFTPRLRLGYQYQKIRASLDSYFIEGSTRNNLTALWFGGTISYEMQLRKRK